MRLQVSLVLSMLVSPLAAQAERTPQQGPGPATTQPRREQDPQLFSAVSGLVRSIADKKGELEQERAKVPVDAAKVAELSAQVDKLEKDLDSIASGIDRSRLDEEADQTTLNEDLEELLRPILQELKSATEEPRQLERLRSQVAAQQRRAQLATAAIENIEYLKRQAEPQSPELEALDRKRLQWDQLRAEAVQGQAVIQAQLDQRERDRKSIFESASALVGGFFRNKGLHMLLALSAFVAVLLSLRFATRRVLRVVAVPRRRDENPFYMRVVRVLLHFLVLLLAVLAGLMVLYAAGDWVLLGLSLLFLLGLVWAAKNTLPRLLEEVRLLLNLGPVREGERVVFEGLPWRVDSLSLYSRLSNPALSGGRIRLPLRDLIGLHSRPSQDKEAWFPCGEGDWVRLGDGTQAKVLTQTPEMVQLVKLGGSRVTYQTADFLGQTPENLSANFRLTVTFGVDYQHQAICTTEIPERMHERLERELSAALGADKIIRLVVEFKEAGASSLDYAVIADLDGEVAVRHDATRRLVQRVLVDACNEHGWVIPFTQITVHQAD